MQRLLHALEVHLLVEHAGHQMTVTGSDARFVARFPTLASMVHFARIGWALRRSIPAEASLSVEWGRFCFPVRVAR